MASTHGTPAYAHYGCREVEGAWVLYPPSSRAPEAVVHFLGGAFVGAAPQLSYRLFLEALSNRNVLVRVLAAPVVKQGWRAQIMCVLQ